MSEKISCFDFHLHSEWSYDATAPVEYYFAEASRLGLTHIAITEHHQMDSLPEALAASAKYPEITYVRGAELTVSTPYGSIDMVCLGMPEVPTPELQQVFAAYHNWQREYGDAYCYNMTQAGYPYSREEREMLLKRYRHQKTLNVQGITHVQNGVQMDYLIGKKFFPDREAVRNVQWSEDFISKPYPAYDFVLPAVKRAGALVFIAHPAKRYFLGKDLARMDALREMLQFDGIECAHTSVPEELTPFYREYALKHKLLCSAGSDCHSAPGDKYQFSPSCSLGRHLGEKRWLEEIMERLKK